MDKEPIDAYVYYTDLPDGINEMVTPCLDGYNIYIDKNLTHEKMEKAYRHALSHIENDFHGGDVQQIENKAHD